MRFRTRLVGASATALLALLTPQVPFGTGSAAAAPGPQAEEVRHVDERAQSENVALAQRLVPVPGYRYVDPWSAEPHLNLPRWRAAFEGYAERMSWHSVVSSNDAENKTVARHAPGAFNSPARMPIDVHMAPMDIREVGFLGLVEMQKPVPPDDLATFLHDRIGGRLVDKFDVNGTHVHVFERSQEHAATEIMSRDDYPNSRFWYAWERSGYVGTFDGADRTTMERWLRAYLSRLPGP